MPIQVKREWTAEDEAASRQGRALKQQGKAYQPRRVKHQSESYNKTMFDKLFK